MRCSNWGLPPIHRMSFPAIHELRGEFSALFYMLKIKLEAARTRELLVEMETALDGHEPDLPERDAESCVYSSAGAGNSSTDFSAVRTCCHLAIQDKKRAAG